MAFSCALMTPPRASSRNLINQDNEVQEEQANLDKDEFELA